MRLIFLDKDFETIGSMSVYSSLIWDRRYYEPGVFELHASVEYFSLMNNARYLFRNDRHELGVIREVEYTQTDKGERTAYCKGYFAEKLLDERVTDTTFNMTGTPEEISRALVTQYFISPAEPDRAMSHIVLGELNNVGTSIKKQNTGDPIGELMFDIEQTQELSHRLVFDYEDNLLRLEVWKGLDRTDEQTENSWAVFSDAFKNVKDVVYDRDESEYKNYAYVAGEGEGAARKKVEVDIRTDPNEERREIYVDARDLQQTTDEHSYTDAQYLDLLRQRGKEKLAEYDLIETVSSNIETLANLVYGVDYDLGDRCTYQNLDVGIECTKRITEIEEVYEGAKVTLNITFGTDNATSIHKIIKKEIS
jgi:hypothetical protein